MGAFGYFPTYALGNLYNIIIYERVKQDIPDLEERISQGDLLVLLEWLREHVHRIGRRKKALELIESMAGGPLTSQPFLKYLKTKYQELYPL
jgi:carboxypeptidase Taq